MGIYLTRRKFRLKKKNSEVRFYISLNNASLKTFILRIVPKFPLTFFSKYSYYYKFEVIFTSFRGSLLEFLKTINFINISVLKNINLKM